MPRIRRTADVGGHDREARKVVDVRKPGARSRRCRRDGHHGVRQHRRLGWLTVIDGRTPFGTVRLEALKAAPADATVGAVLAARSGVPYGSASPGAGP